MFSAPNEYRNRAHPILGTDDSYGNNGYFIIQFRGFLLTCIVSDGGGWEHVSVTTRDGKMNPSWEMMCEVKKIFWDEEDTVLQFHPAKSEYVNRHPYCLHLWRESGKNIQLPPSNFVG